MTSYQLKTQTIYCGDNLKMLKDLPDESVDLCYNNYHFNSGSNKDSFLDIKPVLLWINC